MNTNINAESHKDPDQLERELDARRAHIGDTLNALEQKFSPGRIFDQVMGYTRSNGGEFSQNLVNTVKYNPVPTLLTAVGVTWLLYGQNRSAGDGYGVDSHMGTYDESYDAAQENLFGAGAGHSAEGSTKAGVKEKGEQLKNSLSGKMGNARQRASGSAQGMRQQAQHASESFREQGHRAQVGFSQLLEEQPLAVGAIGIALGALIGGSLPSTRREDQMMGETRDRLASKASESAKETYEKAGAVGRKVADDAKRDVEQEVKGSGEQRAGQSGQEPMTGQHAESRPPGDGRSSPYAGRP